MKIQYKVEPKAGCRLKKYIMLQSPTKKNYIRNLKYAWCILLEGVDICLDI